MRISLVHSKSFSLYWELLKPLGVIYRKIVIYPQRLKEFPVQAKQFAGSWNDNSISRSLYSFVPIDIYSVRPNMFDHGLWTLGEEIVFTTWPKINSHSQIFRYGRSIFCLPNFQISLIYAFIGCLQYVCFMISQCDTDIVRHIYLLCVVGIVSKKNLA